ncbi:uncharacterized protein B0H18DRAFT_1118503 [Fomitopsis serialis]|uniref:uncharacterized protein n=1 Tax=Fomitopsis serialis TaxID=139415 RepID=UPI0020084CE0|nr:uncharacterized protein B0H18DRAFT_1118503 [Neoantrodia serialis]KAH9927227.1 hypothetical protein B0H18DRAFT_1118503 [Neoantrodia serialis]
MAVKAAGSALPPNFFTPHPRRTKGKERAAPGGDFPTCVDVSALNATSVPPPCAGVKRTSSIRSNVSRMRARRLSTRKTMHAPTRDPLPSMKPFTRSVDVAQRRHASSLPEPLGASGSSAPAWQKDRWHKSIRDYSLGRTSDLEEAWSAFEDLCRSDGCESLEVHDMLDFASRIVAAAGDRHLDSISPQSLHQTATRLTAILQPLSSRVTNESSVVDRLRQRCLVIASAAMEESFEVANERLRELLTVSVDARHHQYVARMLAAYVTSVYVHHSALSVLEVLLQHWAGISTYLVRWIPAGHVATAVRKLRIRVADVVTRVDKPSLVLAEWKLRMDQGQQRQVGEYLIIMFCRRAVGDIALDILEAMKVEKLGVKVELQLDIVKALVKNDLFEQANILFASLAEFMGTGKSFDVYQEVGLYLFAHQGDVLRAQEYYGRLAQRDRVTTGHRALVLHAHAVSGDANRVTELFYHFFPPVTSSASAEPPNIFHYTAVILAYAKKGDLVGMNTWLTSMSKAGISPDAHVYNIILKSLAQRGDIHHVAEIMSQMRAAGVRPERHAYTTVIAVLAERKDVLAAEDIYKRAIDDGIIPDRKMISTLMHVYVQAGDWQGVIRTFDYLKLSGRRGIRLSIEVYNTLLKAYVLIGAPFRIVANLFQRMEQTGMRPDAHTFALLIQSACDSGLMWIAKDLLDEMIRLSKDWQTHMHTNIYVLTIMMAGWLRAGNRDRARRTYATMRKRGIQPSAKTYAAIVKEYAKDKSGAGLQIAQEFIRNLTTADPELQLWTESSPSREDALNTLFVPLLSAYAHRERPEVVEDLVAQMGQVGGSQPLGTLTHLLDAYRRVGDGKAVRDLWPRIYEEALRHAGANALLKDTEEDSRPDFRGLGFALCVPLSIYVDAMSAAGFHAEVAQTWAQLQKTKLAFDSHNWNHLAVALVRAGEPERAFQIVEKVIMPTRRRLIASFTVNRDRNPASPIRETPVDEGLEEDEQEFVDGADSAGELTDPETLTIPPEKPLNLDRRALAVRRATQKAGEDLESRQEDFVHGLHILHQLSPMWNNWRPHTIVLAMLTNVLHHLSRGRLVQPVRPANSEPDPFPTMQEIGRRRALASQILQRIHETCPETVRLLESNTTRRKTPRMRAMENQIRRNSAMNY